MAQIDLDTPLLFLSKFDPFTVRDACQGVLDLGGTGSGKTSGSGKTLALAYLRAGMGGVILCAKPEEAALWRTYCRQAGRTNSLIEFDGQYGAYNFIAHELSRQGGGGLNAVVECLMRVLEMARNASPGDARDGDAFWENTTRQILRNALPVLYAATGTVRISDLLEFVRGAPRSPEEMRDDAWQRESAFCRLYTQAAPRLDDDLGSRTTAYWRRDFAMLWLVASCRSASRATATSPAPFSCETRSANSASARANCRARSSRRLASVSTASRSRDDASMLAINTK